MYNEVVKELQTRFDRTKEVHKNLVQRLLQLTLIKETRADLRKLLDTLRSTLASIKRTGTFCLETFMTSLVYLILPTKLQTLWEQHTKKQKKVVGVYDMIDYLGEHAETLPSTLHVQSSGRADPPEKRHKRQDKRQDPSSSPRQRANVHVVTSAPSYKWDCILCKTEKHPLFVCPKWLSYTVAQRLSHVQSKNLCNNCLAVGHSTASCRSTYRCRDCQQNHHTSIHQAAAPPTPVNYSSGAPSQVPDALMMTAQVTLSGPGGQQLPARALIDPGAGISLVSSRVAQLLHLPLTKTTLQFSGVQGTPCKASKHIAQLSLSPLQVDHPKVSIKAAVVATVTNDLPTQELSPVAELPHLAGLDLADKSFHTPGRIDILLGADVYPQLMLNQPMVTGDVTDPAALETIFGWAIIGPVRSRGTYIQPVPAHIVQVQNPEEDLNDQVAKFWEVEEPDHATEQFSSMEEQVQEHYVATTVYSSDSCRYTVTLPRKTEVPALGDSSSPDISTMNSPFSGERSGNRSRKWSRAIWTWAMQS